MKICIVSHLYPVSPEDYKGVFVHRIAAALAARGHEIHVVTPRRPDSRQLEWRDGVAIHRYRHWGWRRGRQLSQLKGTPPLMLGTLLLCGVFVSLAVVLKHRLQLIYAYWVVPGGFIAWLAARLSGRSAVVTAAGSDLNAAARNPLYLPFVKRTLRGADRLIACGSDLQRIAIELGADPVRTTVLPSLVEEAETAGTAESPVETLAGAFGARLLYAGNLAPPKRIDTLLHAMSVIVRDCPEACLTLVGEGEDRAAMEALALQLNLKDSAKFFGRRPHHQILGLMRGADMLLHCSDHEGLPVSIHEGLVAGLPVIAARVGGIPDLVRDGENGFLLASGDAEGFAKAILCLIGDPLRREAMGKASLAFALQHLSQKEIVSKIEEVFRSVYPPDAL